MSKPVPKPGHPTYSVMVVEAIAELKERNGSSRQAIKKHIVEKYAGSIGEATCSKNITKNLKALKDNGKLKEGNGGPYKFVLTDAGKAKPPKPKPKKTVAKKPATKKVAKPKKAAAKKLADVKKSAKKKSAKKVGTPKKIGKSPAKKGKTKSPGKKAKKPTPKKSGKKPAGKKPTKK